MPKAIRSKSTGALVYDDYRDNFVIPRGRAAAVEQFVNQTYGGQQHKKRATRSSNSEDALTWSCFDTLQQLPAAQRMQALRELWFFAYEGQEPPKNLGDGQIFVGKKYGQGKEQTEVDVSIEGKIGAKEFLVFVEVKLFSAVSLANEEQDKPHDQIARKLRVGCQEAKQAKKDFYFWILDIAPKELLRQLHPGASLAEATAPTFGQGGFARKWLTAYWFARYKGGRSVTPLKEMLHDIPDVDARALATNMGWLVWSDVFKVTLRAVLAAGELAQARG